MSEKEKSKYHITYEKLYPGMPRGLETWQQAEWVRCKKSFLYWVKRWAWIEDKASETMIRFRPWPKQLDLMKSWVSGEHKYHINLKARQLGLSWMAILQGVHDFNFKALSCTLVESDKEIDAVLLVEKGMKAFYKMPEWMRTPLIKDDAKMKRAGYKEKDSKGTWIVKGLDSTIEAVATGGGASRTVTLNIRDEAALVDSVLAAKMHKATYPTILNSGGRVLVISTAEMASGWFYNMYWNAKKGLNNFVAHFLPWDTDIRRGPDWRDNIMGDFDNEDDCINQFPATDVEAFLVAGSTVFSKQALNKLIKDDFDPPRLEEPEIGYVTGGYGDDHKMYGSWIKDSFGITQLWRHPVHGRKYGIGVDLAEGKTINPNAPRSKRLDFSVAEVFDLGNNEQVARIQAREIPPDEFAIICCKLGAYYNNALLVPEINKEGLSFLKQARAIYDNIYYRETVIDKFKQTITKEFGWLTTEKTRSLWITALGMLIKDSALPDDERRFPSCPKMIIHCSDTLQEFTKFIRNVNGRPEAASGEHDDDVVACGLIAVIITSGMWGEHTYHIPEEPEEILSYAQKYARAMAKKNAARLDEGINKRYTKRERRIMNRMGRRRRA